MAFFVSPFLDFLSRFSGSMLRVPLSSSFLLLCWLFLSSSVLSADRLQVPAMASDLASRSLLLDITQTSLRIVAVGERGHIVYSEDQGMSWQQASVPVSVSLTAVDFSDDKFGWAVGHDGVILATTDGGLSWSKQLDGHQLNQQLVDLYHAAQQRLAGKLELAISKGFDADELEERVELLEMTYEDALVAQEEGPTKPFLDVLFVDQNRGWAIGSYGLIFETEDGGQHWSAAMLLLDNPDGFHLNAIILTQSGELMIAGEAGILFRSVDLGQSWERLYSPYEGSFYSLLEIQPQGGVLAVGLRGRAYLSLDRGDQWLAIDSSTRLTLSSALQMNSGELILVGNSGAVVIANPGTDKFSNYLQTERRSFTGLVEASDQQLVLTGQGGITLLSRQKLEEARP